MESAIDVTIRALNINIDWNILLFEYKQTSILINQFIPVPGLYITAIFQSWGDTPQPLSIRLHHNGLDSTTPVHNSRNN